MSGSQKDIRSYFTIGGKKNHSDKKPEPAKSSVQKKTKKRGVIVIDSDSDEEDPIPSSLKRKKVTEKSSTNTELHKSENPKPSSKLKAVNVSDVFGNEKVKRLTSDSIKLESKQPPRTTKPEPKQPVPQVGTASLETSVEKHSDADFESTLQEIDTAERKKFREKQGQKSQTELTKKISVSAKSNGEKLTDKQSAKTIVSDNKQDVKSNTKHKHVSPEKHAPHAEESNPKLPKSSLPRESGSQRTAVPELSTPSLPPSSEKSELPKHSPKEKSKSPKTTPHKIKSKLTQDHEKAKQDTSTVKSPSINDPIEKRRQSAYMYQKYLHREGPKHHGLKKLPKGKPNCLAGLVFVLTGVLDSLERDEAVSLIQKYGGKVTLTPSRRTNYLVVGDDPGPSKITKAETLGIPQLSEDDLLKLICKKSGIPEDSQQWPDQSEGEDDMTIEDPDTAEIETKGNKIADKPSVRKSGLEEFKKEKSKTVSAIEANKSSLVSETAKRDSGSESVLWVEKYRPTSIKQIIGQQGDRSAVKKLMNWLSNWHKNHSGGKKPPRPSPWAKDDSGAFFKAALLSGPPGIGKTTSAYVVCKELGFDLVEFNASDTRSKRLLQEEVTELLSSQSLHGYFSGDGHKKTTSRHVLLMDEVDGMAGNEDRGGIQELIAIIKNTRIPIICTCNDRQHPKIRSLVNYCYDLPFYRPRMEQIRSAMMSICFKEGINISPEALADIITASNQDLRQVLHHLSMWSAKTKTFSAEKTKADSQRAKKDLKLGPWDVVRKVFSAEEHKRMSVADKSDLFFHDYSLGPLFVQENYLSAVPHAAKGNKLAILERVADAADAISLGDVVDRAIRSKNAWNLLPTQALFASVLPGEYMEGHLSGQISFPAWLGKNSRARKFDRLHQELQTHMRLSMTASKEAVAMDYLVPLRDKILAPLIRDGIVGVDEAVSAMQKYHLTREDLDSLLETALWPGTKDPMSQIDSRVKAAFTRTYNKVASVVPYSLKKVPASKAAVVTDLDLEAEEEEVAAEEDTTQNDDISSDAMIKAKKRSATKLKDEAGPSAPKKGRGKATDKEVKGKGKRK